MRRIFAALLMVLAVTSADAQTGRRIVLNGVPGWVLKGAAVDINFATSQIYGCAGLSSCLSITRASSKTDLLPTSASGASYNTFGNNVLAITPGKGVLIEESRTNYLLNSTAPATQTTGSLGTGTYTLWVNGSGSATMSLGTGVGCGVASASQGTPVNFTITVAGTCIVTVAGSLNEEQLENGAFGTSFIATTGAAATRATDNVTGIGSLLTSYQSTALTQYVKTVGLVGIFHSYFTGTSNSSAVGYASDATDAGIYNGTTQRTAVVGNSGNYTTGTVNTVTSFDGSGDSVVANGGTETTSSDTFAATTSMQIGANNSVANSIYGYISRLTLWTSRLPAATRSKLSTQ